MYRDECRAKCTLEWWHGNTEDKQRAPWLHQTVATEKIYNTGDWPVHSAVLWTLRAYCDHKPELLITALGYMLQCASNNGWIAGFEDLVEDFPQSIKDRRKAHDVKCEGE